MSTKVHSISLIDNDLTVGRDIKKSTHKVRTFYTSRWAFFAFSSISHISRACSIESQQEEQEPIRIGEGAPLRVIGIIIIIVIPRRAIINRVSSRPGGSIGRSRSGLVHRFRRTGTYRLRCGDVRTTGRHDVGIWRSTLRCILCPKRGGCQQDDQKKEQALFHIRNLL